MLVNAEMPLFLLKSIQRLFHLVNYTTPLGGSLLKQNRFCGVLSEAPGGVAAITAAQLLKASLHFGGDHHFFPCAVMPTGAGLDICFTSWRGEGRERSIVSGE